MTDDRKIYFEAQLDDMYGLGGISETCQAMSYLSVDNFINKTSVLWKRIGDNRIIQGFWFRDWYCFRVYIDLPMNTFAPTKDILDYHAQSLEELVMKFDLEGIIDLVR